jgi:hypothetical protein
MGNSATKTDDTTEYEFIGKPYYEIEYDGTKCEEGKIKKEQIMKEQIKKEQIKKEQIKKE